MDLEKIPNVFWYSVSFAIIAITLTFSWSAMRSSGMTIEIANAKIAVTNQVSELEKINEELKQQTEELEQEKRELKQQIKQLAKQNASRSSIPKAELDKLSNVIKPKASTRDTRKKLDSYGKRLEDIKQQVIKK